MYNLRGISLTIIALLSMQAHEQLRHSSSGMVPKTTPGQIRVHKA